MSKDDIDKDILEACERYMMKPKSPYVLPINFNELDNKKENSDDIETRD